MTDPVVTSIANQPAKKPRTRKPKPPAAPKVERKKRDTPARTLRVRLAALSPHHVEAFDRARKRGGEAYEKAVREAMDNADALADADARLAAAEAAVNTIKGSVAALTGRAVASQPVLDRLAMAAKILAGLDGEPTPLLDPDGRDEGAET